MNLRPDLTNWRWRLNNLYKIINKDGQLVNLQENDIQSAINSSKKRKKMILKYRQGGVTTNEIIKQLDYVCFNHNKTACILAHKKDVIESIFQKVRLAHSCMPEDMRPQLAKGGGSKYEYQFPEMKSKIYCDLEVRGGTIHWLHISEAAFADPGRIKATLEAVPIDGIVTFESTPNGLGNDFYKKWVNPTSGLQKLFFPWFYHYEYSIPGDLDPNSLTPAEKALIRNAKAKHDINVTLNQILFRRAKIEDLGDLFPQEYPEDDIACFLASGGSAFNLVKIKAFLDGINRPIEDNNLVQIYEKYDKGKTYVVGADTAEGKGGDYSVATIFNAKTFEQVAVLRSNRLNPREFAHQVNDLCHKYRHGNKPFPKLAVERNNHGHAVLLELNEHLAYSNLYYYKDGDAGWRTDSISRPLMIDTFIDGVEQGRVTLKSEETLKECLTLINNNGKIEAADGEHDDCIIACALAVQMCLQEGVSGIYDNIDEKIRV